jgi:predicted alpha/beta-hydrolase family hydrolase
MGTTPRRGRSMGAQYTRRRVRIRVDPATVVSGVLAGPRAGAAGPLAHVALVLGHGAGADMTNAFLSAVHEGLAARGALVLKFNFAYTEAGRKAPDPPARLLAAFRAAAAWLAGRPAARGRLRVLGGKSMGGRIASHAVALGDPACDGLLFLGYPLHPAGQPAKLRDTHLAAIRAPMLFVAGTRDPLCDLALLRPVLARLGRRATLAVIADGDHSFHVRKSSGRDDAAATAEVIDAAARWLARLRVSRPASAKGGSRRGSPAPSSSSARGGTTRARSGRAPRT